jgi:hypothetical protein
MAAKSAKSELTRIPGVGDKMAGHLARAGFPTIASLRGRSADEVYAADCAAQGAPVDRCALYCYRLAVHYADHGGSLPEGRRNWWDWKD